MSVGQFIAAVVSLLVSVLAGFLFGRRESRKDPVVDKAFEEAKEAIKKAELKEIGLIDDVDEHVKEEARNDAAGTSLGDRVNRTADGKW